MEGLVEDVVNRINWDGRYTTLLEKEEEEMEMTFFPVWTVDVHFCLSF